MVSKLIIEYCRYYKSSSMVQWLKGLSVMLFILMFYEDTLCAQEYVSIMGIQKISNGGLWYEYRKHPEVRKAPTLVFESGALSTADYWNTVIDSVSTYANTIRYDRAGLGRSYVSSDSVRSSAQIARELHELLDSLGLKHPVILACHSVGGFHGRTFTHLFGHRVQALVLIESPCTGWEDMIRSSLSKTQNQQRDSILQQSRSTLSPSEQKEYEASVINRKFLEQIPTSDLPVFILHGNNHDWPEGYDDEPFNEQWKVCQQRLSQISTKSHITVIPEAGHHVFEDINFASFLEKVVLELKRK